MAQAKLTPQQGVFLVCLRSTLHDETRQALKSDLFAMVKAKFGIPDDHKLKVEVDATSDPQYLVLLRKKNGMPYELGQDGKWTGVDAPVRAPAQPPIQQYVVYVGFTTSSRSAKGAADSVLDYLADNDIYPDEIDDEPMPLGDDPLVILANKLH